VRRIGESRGKDDLLDAQTLARLARIDPQLLCPVKHRSAKAHADLTVIRARTQAPAPIAALFPTPAIAPIIAPTPAVPPVYWRSANSLAVRACRFVAGPSCFYKEKGPDMWGSRGTGHSNRKRSVLTMSNCGRKRTTANYPYADVSVCRSRPPRSSRRGEGIRIQGVIRYRGKLANSVLLSKR
jgi:hypothetical protein